MDNPFLPLLAATADLKQLPRTGWLLAGVRLPESVADHSFATALLALALAEAINADPAGQGLGAPLDIERVLRMALLHDLAESLVTDLPKRAAERIGADAKRDAEAAAMGEIVATLPAGEAWQALHAEYAAGAGPEARLVRDADKLEMVHQALRYRSHGYRTLDDFLRRPSFAYPLSGTLFTD
jgi:putative hydrolase of HD superfamily